MEGLKIWAITVSWVWIQMKHVSQCRFLFAENLVERNVKLIPETLIRILKRKKKKGTCTFSWPLKAGVTNLWYLMPMIGGGANVTIIEINYTINVIHLNHPKSTPPPPSMEKLSSTKPLPHAKKAGTTALKCFQA